MFHVKNVLYLSILLSLQNLSNETENVTTRNTKRIVGGRSCAEENHSFIVSLQNRTRHHFCGGSLLNEYWVLTAAHCSFGDEIIAVAARDTPGQEVRKVDKAFPHPYYKFSSFMDDIGLLKLSQPIDESKFISYVKIPEQSITGEVNNFCPMVLVMGWGRLSAKSTTSSKTLQCVILPVLTEIECRRYYRPLQYVFITSMCTLSKEGKDVCRGDSGGPVICREKEVQLGIVSFGKECGNPNSPSAYTRVDDYLTFISSTMTSKKSIQLCNKIANVWFLWSIWFLIL